MWTSICWSLTKIITIFLKGRFWVTKTSDSILISEKTCSTDEFSTIIIRRKYCYDERGKASDSRGQKLKYARHHLQKCEPQSVQDGDFNHNFFETAYNFARFCRYYWENLLHGRVFNNQKHSLETINSDVGFLRFEQK